MKCEYGYDCYYRIGEVCKFADFSPCEEPMVCLSRERSDVLVPVEDEQCRRQESKKEYLVSAKGTEWLAEAVIEADTPEEAQELYEQDWANGGIEGYGYEFSAWRIREAHSCEENRGKTSYLAKFSIREGEHEYGAAFLVQAESIKEATTIAKSQEHEPIIPDDLCEDTLSCWDYGDGTTAARLDGVVEIGCEEALVLKRLGLVFDFN